MLKKLSIFTVISILSLILLAGCVSTSTEDLDKVKQENLLLENEILQLNQSNLQLSSQLTKCQNANTELNNSFAQYNLAYELREIANENLSIDISLSKQIDSDYDVMTNTNMSSSLSECEKYNSARIDRTQSIIKQNEINIIRAQKQLSVFKTTNCLNSINKYISIANQLNEKNKELIRLYDKDYYCSNYFDSSFTGSQWINTYIDPINTKLNEIHSLFTQSEQNYYDMNIYCSLE